MPMDAAPVCGDEERRPPIFSEAFRHELQDLLAWRRDERHFRADLLPAGLLERLIATACLAPSVGNAQPWRFVDVRCASRKARVAESFATENALAASDQPAARARSYGALKLAGLREAPVHLAVFCDEDVSEGHRLGRRTMPETLRYSVVCAVHTFWLAARAEGLGVGWVSILDPKTICRELDVPETWSLVGYLCVGWPQENHIIPELARVDWQQRLSPASFIVVR